MFWKSRRVLVTGHTGFKGAWLTLWLRSLGADVCGVALEAGDGSGLLDQFQLRDDIDHNVIDIRDRERLSRIVEHYSPDVVFHLAAQPLVRESYQHPVQTWETNVTGSMNVMDAVSRTNGPVAVVMVTTDKVYENREWVHSYRESDVVGGHDPYSASKAAMELAVASYRKSFCGDGRRLGIATVRAGNVIGGGDFAKDRIVPDIVRSLERQDPVVLRNPGATRPWQHVLDPLAGYMKLAEAISVAQNIEDITRLGTLTSGWNFGPSSNSNRTVEELVTESLETWPGSYEKRAEPDAPHEATYLALSTDKAARCLNWSSRWTFEESVRQTMEWYRDVQLHQTCPRSIALRQIEEFEQLGSSTADGGTLRAAA